MTVKDISVHYVRYCNSWWSVMSYYEKRAYLEDRLDSSKRFGLRTLLCYHTNPYYRINNFEILKFN